MSSVENRGDNVVHKGFDASRRRDGVYKTFRKPFKFSMMYAVDSFDEVAITFVRKRGLLKDELVTTLNGDLQRIRGFSDREIGYLITVLDAEKPFIEEMLKSAKL